MIATATRDVTNKRVEMKPNRGGFENKGTFQIAVNAETFRILSSGLYSDPVKAIVREYSTNAKDSHVEAGNFNPFDVQLPTRSNPLFMIRDYGTGMPREQVETVCRTYGASTKRDTNLSTGKFGLGFKSALAYVNTFSVISYYNGRLFKYVVMTDDKGMPQLMHADDMETDEPNGVKIQFYINPDDTGEFIKAAKEVYPFFEIKPNFIGESKPVIPELNYVWEGREEDFTWKIFKENKSGTDNNSPLIIMGNNVYPLYGADERSYRFKEDTIHYYVDTDLFEPTPSRESLQWSTNDKVRLDNMRSCVLSRIVERFEAETAGFSEWEKILYHASLPNIVKKQIDKRTSPHAVDVVKLSTGLIEVTVTRSSYSTDFSVLNIDPRGLPIAKIDYPERGRNKLLQFVRPKNYKYSTHRVVDITPAAPIEILIYDTSRINDIIPEHVKKHTIVLGTPSQDISEAVAVLKKDLEDQRIPHNLRRLSDVLKTIPRKESVKSNTKEYKTPTKCTGVFEYSNFTFSRIASIEDRKYYVPFDDDATLSVIESFKSLYDGASFVEKVKYDELSRILKMEEVTNEQVCYIRPRFVPKYSEVLKSWPEEADKALAAACKDNWLWLVVLLNNYTNACNLSNHCADLVTWALRVGHPTLVRRISYPLTRALAETAIAHRINYYRYVQPKVPHGVLYNAEMSISEEFRTAHGSISRLLNIAWRIEDITKHFKNWFERLEEETAAVKRCYPWLFLSEEEALNSIMLTKSFQVSKIH